MSFVTTQPEALTAAASQLQGIGTAMATENAAAAPPTTGVVPAAADEVSALQATQFTAYGDLYQSISAQATAIHEMFVNTLGISAGSYGETEAANSAAAGMSSSGLSGLLGSVFGSGLSSSTASGSSGPLASAFNALAGNFGAATSDLTELGGLGGSGSAAAGPEAAAGEAGGLGGGAVLSGAVAPAGLGGAPVLAGLGQASSVGGLSVPPSWASGAIPAANPTPATLAGAGWTTAAPQSTPVATMPAGMPSVASAGRGGLGFGAPRYGVKPTVMPKPAVV